MSYSIFIIEYQHYVGKGLLLHITRVCKIIVPDLDKMCFFPQLKHMDSSHLSPQKHKMLVIIRRPQQGAYNEYLQQRLFWRSKKNNFVATPLTWKALINLWGKFESSLGWQIMYTAAPIILPLTLLPLSFRVGLFPPWILTCQLMPIGVSV